MSSEGGGGHWAPGEVGEWVLNNQFKSMNRSNSNNSYLMAECAGVHNLSMITGLSIMDCHALCNPDINHCQTNKFKLKYYDGSVEYKPRFILYKYRVQIIK